MFDSRFAMADLKGGELNALVKKAGGAEAVRQILRGELEMAVAKPGTLAKAKPASGAIICVDRSVRPKYPDWTGIVMHPELENTGPKRFDLAKVTLWLHDLQKNGGRVEGHRIYDHLKATDTLKSCLGLRDGEEIQKKGIEVFRKYFGGKAVFLWKSVVRRRSGNLSVPYLYEVGDKVGVRWFWLGYSWYDAFPTARFAS